MTWGAGESGNPNGTVKTRRWSAAIERALDKRAGGDGQSHKELDKLAEKLLANCDTGDLAALKELGDRLDGKPKQQMELTGDKNNPINVTLSRNDAAVI